MYANDVERAGTAHIADGFTHQRAAVARSKADRRRMHVQFLGDFKYNSGKRALGGRRYMQDAK